MEVATTTSAQVPADLTQRLNNLQAELATIPAVSQTPADRNLMVEWTMDAAGLDGFSPTFLVVNQGDAVHLTFINNDTEDGHTFTLITRPYNFQINLTAPGQVNSLNGLTFTTPPTSNSAGGNVAGQAGSLIGAGSFVATTAGVYKYVRVYHQFMVGYLVVLPNLAYSPSP